MKFNCNIAAVLVSGFLADLAEKKEGNVCDSNNNKCMFAHTYIYVVFALAATMATQSQAAKRYANTLKFNL